MAWYWWVLLAIGVVLIGILKMKVWKMMKENRKKKQQEIED